MNELVTACNAVRYRLPGRAVLVTAAALLLVVRTDAAAAPAAIEAAPWALYRTPHFEILTTDPDDRVRSLIADVTLFRSVVISLLGEGAEILGSRRVRFLVLPKPGDVQFLFGSAPGVTGFTRPALSGDLMVVGKPDLRRSFGVGNQVVFHEYVHQLVQMRSQSRHPSWYAEGIADFLSTMRRKGDRVVLGAIPESRRLTLKRDVSMPLDEVVQATSTWALPIGERSAFYAQSWLLVHHLLLAEDRKAQGFAQSLSRYLDAYDRGEPSLDAFRSHFKVSLAALEGRLKRHMRHLPEIDYPLSAFDSSDMYEREPLALRAKVLLLARYFRESNPREALRMLNRLALTMPQDAEVQAARGVALGFLGESEEAIRLMDSATADSPDNYLVWLEAGRLYRRLCTVAAEGCITAGYSRAAGRAFARAHALHPDDVEIRTRHAQYLLQTPERGDALPLLAEALSEAPWSLEVLHAIAIAYLARGELDRAALYLNKALGWSVDYPELQDEFSRLLAEIDRLRLPGPG